MNVYKGLQLAIKRFFKGTPDHLISYDKCESEHLRKNYYKQLRKSKLLEIELETLKLQLA